MYVVVNSKKGKHKAVLSDDKILLLCTLQAMLHDSILANCFTTNSEVVSVLLPLVIEDIVSKRNLMKMVF